jgi:hypothetical protein
MLTEKRRYTSPQLVVYGDVEALTLNGTSVNSDSPSGNPDTAYCVRAPGTGVPGESICPS